MQEIVEKEQINAQLLDYFGTDRDIAHAAWTSSLEQQKKENRPDEDVERVVRYLINNRHSSPIEQVSYRFYLEMPIFVARQFMRHRLQSPNEMSGRYRTMPADFFQLPPDIRDLADQAGDSFLADDWTKINRETYDFYETKLDFFRIAEDKGRITNEEYKRLREILRGVLGTAYMTKITTVFNLRSLANFFRLRLDPHAQAEIRLLAQKMLKSVEQANNCPIAIASLKANNWQI